MRRSLVLGDEAAHHPFLQSLPPHVRGGRAIAFRARPAPRRHPLRLALAGAGDTARHGLRGATAGITARDMRHFLLAYCSCFLAVSAFIW